MRIVDAMRRAAGVAVPGSGWFRADRGMGASGTALGVDPQAEAETSGIIRVLTVGADLNIGDVVRTGAKGQVQIKFSDQTELVVGPNSVLTIEDYLLRGDNSAGKAGHQRLAGTFRFATGVASRIAT
ncbi:MAG: FecR domain-containing protein [Devosia sp.]|nr:FecR domain-containing protein [Devosia sp.]